MEKKIKKAQEAVWYNTDKALYLDLKGSLEGIVKDFKQSA